MATNQTANYDLNQWLSTDQVLRTDFNADNAKLDAALGALNRSKADSAQLAAAVGRVSDLESSRATKAELGELADQVEENENAIQQLTADLTKITFGFYAGDGADTRMIQLGFSPKAVLLVAGWGAMGYYANAYQYAGGLALPGHPATTNHHGLEYLSLTSSGFQVDQSISDYQDSVHINDEDMIYYYIAFS